MPEKRTTKAEQTRSAIVDAALSLFRTGGSTSHAPGGIFQNNPSRTVSKLAQWSVETFLDVNKDGDSPVYWPTGSLEVAEVRFPLFFRRHEFRPDSGGAGRFRGGCGRARRFPQSPTESRTPTPTRWASESLRPRFGSKCE